MRNTRKLEMRSVGFHAHTHCIFFLGSVVGVKPMQAPMCVPVLQPHGHRSGVHPAGDSAGSAGDSAGSAGLDVVSLFVGKLLLCR